MLRAQIIIIVIIIISSSSISIIIIVISIIILDVTCTNYYYYCISYAIAGKNPQFHKIVTWKLMLPVTFNFRTEE